MRVRRSFAASDDVPTPVAGGWVGLAVGACVAAVVDVDVASIVAASVATFFVATAVFDGRGRVEVGATRVAVTSIAASVGRSVGGNAVSVEVGDAASDAGSNALKINTLPTIAIANAARQPSTRFLRRTRRTRCMPAASLPRGAETGESEGTVDSGSILGRGGSELSDIEFLVVVWV